MSFTEECEINIPSDALDKQDEAVEKAIVPCSEEPKKENVEDVERTIKFATHEPENQSSGEDVESTDMLSFNETKENSVEDAEKTLMASPQEIEKELLADGTEADMDCALSKAAATIQEHIRNDLPQIKLINSASSTKDITEMAHVEGRGSQEVINTTQDEETSNVKYSGPNNTEVTVQDVTVEQEPMDVDLSQNNVVHLASPGTETVVVTNLEESENQIQEIDTCKSTTVVERTERTFETDMLCHMVTIQQEHMEMDLPENCLVHEADSETEVAIMIDIGELSGHQKQRSNTCKGNPTGVDNSIIGSSSEGKETSSQHCHETSSTSNTDLLSDIVTLEQELELPQNKVVHSVSPGTEAATYDKQNEENDKQKEIPTATYDNVREEAEASGREVAVMADVEESVDQDVPSNTLKKTTGKNVETVYDNGMQAILETSESETSTLKEYHKYNYDCKREPEFTEQNNIELKTGKTSDKMESKSDFHAGDLVWAKVKSHPWWPGQIFDATDASAASKKIRRSGRSLVAFFGDGTYGWLQESQLLPFRQHFEEKIKQTNMKSFCRAVSEALNEICRRSELGLNCKHSTGLLHSKDTFPDTNVGVQKGVRIKSHADISISKTAFQPQRTLYFVKTLACSPLASQSFNLDYPELCGHAYGVRRFLFFPETSPSTIDVYEDTNQIRDRAIRDLDMKQKISEFDACIIEEDNDKKRRKIQQLDGNSGEEKGKKQSDSHEKTNPSLNTITQDVGEEASTYFHSQETRKTKKQDISNSCGQSKEADETHGEQKLSQIIQEPGKNAEEIFRVNPLEAVNENALLFEHELKNEQESNVTMDDKLTGKRASLHEDEMIRQSKKNRKTEEEEQTTLQVRNELSNTNQHEGQNTFFTFTEHTSRSVPVEGCVIEQIKTNKDKVNQIPELHTAGGKHSHVKDAIINNQGNLQPPTNGVRQLLEKRLKRRQDKNRKGSISNQNGMITKKATDASMDVGYDRKPAIPKMPQLERKLINDNSDQRSRDLIPDKPSCEKLCVSLLDLLEDLYILAANPLNSMESVDSRERVVAGILKFRTIVFLKSARSVKTVSQSRSDMSDIKAAEGQDSGSDSKSISQSQISPQDMVNVTERSDAVHQANAGFWEQYPGHGTLDTNELKKVPASIRQGAVVKRKKSTMQNSKANIVTIKNPSSQTGLTRNQDTSSFQTLKSSSTVGKPGTVVSPQIRTEKPSVQELAEAARKRKSEVEKEEAAKILEKKEKSSISRHHGRNAKHYFTLETSLPHKRSPDRARNAKIPESLLGLFIQFPQGFALPTETQLREMFSQFGTVESAGIRIYKNTSSAQVVFKHSQDAELAYKHCSNTRMFETPEVSYKLRHFSQSQRTSSCRDTPAATKHQPSDKADPIKSQYSGHPLSKGQLNGNNPGQAEIGDNSYSLHNRKLIESLKNNDMTLNNNSIAVTSVSNVNIPSIDIKDQLLKLLHQVSVIVSSSYATNAT